MILKKNDDKSKHARKSSRKELLKENIFSVVYNIN